MTISLHRTMALLGGVLLAGSLIAVPAANALPSASAAPVSTNVALSANGGVATASGAELAKWAAPMANDGVRSLLPNGEQSRWSSNYSDSAWLQVQLAAPTTLDHVTLRWEAACAAQYKIQVSDDGAAWTDASGVLNGTCDGIDRVPLTAAGEVSYVRMQGIKRTAIGSSFYGMSLWELEAWTGAEPKAVAPLGLVPIPATVTPQDGAGFSLSAESRIITAPAFGEAAARLAEVLRASTGYELPVVETGEPAASDIMLASDAAVGGGNAEAYELSATASGARIAAADAHGAFNGAQTLRQLFPAAVESPTVVQAEWTTPALEIEDSPRFGYRGVMLDVARSFQTVDEVKEIIDAIASFKMNVLHLHLADDQGWRIEITNEGRAEGDTIDYSLLTSVSGARAMTQGGYAGEAGRTGFYTQADYRELVAYADERFVQIVPEIDLPGHTNAALGAIPQLNTPGSSHPATATQPTAPHNGTGAVGYSYLDPDSEVTYTFIEHVLGQLSGLTTGDLIHVGGDESHDMVARYGQAKFNAFVARVLGIVHDLGKSAEGWNEIARTTSALQAGDKVQYWAGSTAELPAAAAAGAQIVASRGSSSYLDMKYNAKTPIGLTWACSGICDLTQYYSWNPGTFVSGLTEAQVAGPEAPMWSETIRGGEQAEFMMFPRAIAHAEMGWSPQARRDVTDFTQRVGVVGARLTAAGVNYYDTAQATWFAQGAGLHVEADVAAPTTLQVARFFAPGTTAATGGATISTDLVNDADGVSRSEFDGAFGATIEWGDGTSSPATFVAEQARGVLNSSGAYVISGSHAYDAGGSRSGRVVGSDGRVVAEFTVQVGAEETVAFEATAETRCLGSKAYVVVRATNGEAAPIALTMQTAFGEKSFSGIAAGKSATHSFAVREASVPAGDVTVTATRTADGAPISATTTVGYDARSCG
jgi:hexosaminidase